MAVLVVHSKKLFRPEDAFEGFLPISLGDFFLPRILASFKYVERTDDLENNPLFKQIIAYVWLVNPRLHQAFFYRRTDSPVYREARLRNKWSGGVGGHIEDDADSLHENPVKAAMLREMAEEVVLSNYPEPKPVGFVYNELGAVERQHFGVVGIAETVEEPTVGDGEIAEGRFMTVQEIDSLFANPSVDIENYTRLTWPFVKNHLLELSK